jgi:hypothetical protein
MYVADVNLLYLYNLNAMVNRDEGLPNILPRKLAITLRDLYKNTKGLTYTDWLERQRGWDKYFPMAGAELSRKNFERTTKYQKEMAERLKDDKLNYFVGSEVVLAQDGDADSNELAGLRRRYPKGVRVFMVSTPIGIMPMYLKDRGRFKILFVGPYPWD